MLVITAASGMPRPSPTPKATPRFEPLDVTVAVATGAAAPVPPVELVFVPPVTEKSSLITLQLSQSLSAELNTRICIGISLVNPASLAAGHESLRTLVSVTLARWAVSSNFRRLEMMHTQQVRKCSRSMYIWPLPYLHCEHWKCTRPLQRDVFACWEAQLGFAIAFAWWEDELDDVFCGSNWQK